MMADVVHAEIADVLRWAKLVDRYDFVFVLGARPNLFIAGRFRIIPDGKATYANVMQVQEAPTTVFMRKYGNACVLFVGAAPYEIVALRRLLEQNVPIYAV